MSQSQGIGVRRPSRRTIASGAAWAVPVIAVGAAAPLAAASGNEPTFELDPEASCKYPGNSFRQFPHGYNLVFTVDAPAAGELCITDIQVPNGTAEVILVAPDDGGNPDCTSIPAGPSTVTFVVGAENSANGTGTFTFSFNGVAGTFTAAFTNFRPCTQADVPT